MSKSDRYVYVAIGVVLVLILAMIYLIDFLYPGRLTWNYDPETEVRFVLEESALNYGFPQPVIASMDEVVLQQIYEEEIRFASAQLVYFNKDGREILRHTVTEGSSETMPWQEPKHDFRMVLVNGLCYEEGNLAYVWSCLNYRWNRVPWIRGGDPYEMIWSEGTAVTLDDGYEYGFWQENRNGEKIYLQMGQRAGGIWQNGIRWYGSLHLADRLGVKGLAGYGAARLYIQPGVDRMQIQVCYTHDSAGRIQLGVGDMVRETQYFKAMLELDHIEERRVQNETH